MPACRQAQGQADWQAGEQAGGQEYLPPGKKECLPVHGSIGYKQVELLFTCEQCRLVDFLTHFCHCFPIVSFFALWHFTVPMPVCLRAGRHKGRQTGKLVNRQAGKNAYHPARKNACRFANLKAYRQAAMLFSLVWQHLALSWQLVAFLSRISDLGNTLPLHPSGRAKPKARTAGPGSVLLLGSRKVSGNRCLAGSVTTGLSPIRRVRIFVSSKTQQGMFRVTRNLAGYSRKPCL